MKAGVIGFGRIGANVARRILAAGHAVAVHDVRPDLGREVRDAGMAWCASPAEVAALSDVVLCCVYGPDEVRTVLHGGPGLLAGAREGLIVVEMTTIDPALARDNAAALAARGVAYLDAPVTGGIEGARSGTLALMIGGDMAALDRVRPVLCCFATRIFHLGEAGTGSTMKAVVQASFLLQLLAFTEAIAVGESAGLRMADMFEVLAASTAHHPTIGKRYGSILAGDRKPRFEVTGALKDLAIVREIGNSAGLPTSLTEAGLELFTRATELGHGADDLWTALDVYRTDRTHR